MLQNVIIWLYSFKNKGFDENVAESLHNQTISDLL